MSKHDKDYDTTVARMVGNMLAGDAASWQNQTSREAFAVAAIKTAKIVVKKLREDAINGS